MKTEITIEQIYHNSSLQSFFFRTQSEKTFEELAKAVEDTDELFDAIENHFDDLDAFEEFVYESSVNEILEYLELELDYEQDEA